MSKIRYGSLFRLFARHSLAQMLAYRLSSTFIVVFGTLFVLAEVIGTLVFYQFTDSIAGWGFYEFLALLATFQLINVLYQFLFVISHENLMENILEGTLDYDLIRPVDSQFICSIKQLDYPSMFNMLVPIILLTYCWPHLSITAPIPTLGGYILLLVCGVYLYYLMNQFFVSLAFWIERPQKLAGVPEYLLEFSSRPRGVYPRLLQFIFTIVFPIISAVNLPAEILKGTYEVSHLIIMMLFLIIFSFVVRLQWKKGTARYASAS